MEGDEGNAEPRRPAQALAAEDPGRAGGRPGTGRRRGDRRRTQTSSASTNYYASFGDNYSIWRHFSYLRLGSRDDGRRRGATGCAPSAAPSCPPMSQHGRPALREPPPSSAWCWDRLRPQHAGGSASCSCIEVNQSAAAVRESWLPRLELLGELERWPTGTGCSRPAAADDELPPPRRRSATAMEATASADRGRLRAYRGAARATAGAPADRGVPRAVGDITGGSSTGDGAARRSAEIRQAIEEFRPTRRQSSTRWSAAARRAR